MAKTVTRRSTADKTNEPVRRPIASVTTRNTEIAKGISMITVEIIEYLDRSVVIKTILMKSSGTISIMSADTGQGLAERTIPFDTFAQVIDGRVNLMMGGKEHLLETGTSIIIPAHAMYYVKPDGRFKMILTVIKSAYE